MTRFLAACLTVIGTVFLTSQALAETWVDTGHLTLIDTGSFRRGPNGLLYYMNTPKARNCRTSQSCLEPGSRLCSNFVCSRVK